tara:strand:- start:7067 stop:7390 length:324 start_codon:yes stop_codon:yes gene_type:complete
MIEMMPGVKIIDKLDNPEILMAVSSSVFLIFKKNQIPDNKIINGKKLCNKLGVNSIDKIIGVLIDTSISLKKLISSNKFIIKPKVKNIRLAFKIILINSIPRYLFIK